MNHELLQLALLGAALAMPLAATADGKARGRDTEFHARLSGAQEVPPVTTAASGRFKIEFKRDMSAAEFRLRVNDGTRVTQSHIHCGPEGSNGPVVIFLGGFHQQGWDVDGWWVSNVSVTDANIVNPACGTTLAAIADSIRAGMAYVNVHTVANPGGEIRGQLTRGD